MQENLTYMQFEWKMCSFEKSFPHKSDIVFKYVIDSHALSSVRKEILGRELKLNVSVFHLFAVLFESDTHMKNFLQ